MGCNGFFDKDNLPSPKPLVPFRPQATAYLAWSTGVGSGVSKNDYLKLRPQIKENLIYTTGTNGAVTAFNKFNGQVIWQTNTHIPITTGPGVGDNAVVVGSHNGDVVALSLLTGKVIWQKMVPGEVLATPAVASSIVIIKTIDGYVYALDEINGHDLWAFQQLEPSMLLRGSSNPIIKDHNVFVGFANGTLAKLGLNDGRLDWLETIARPQGAFAIKRMVDIDADPVIYGHRVYAATYQGKIAALNFYNGHVKWAQDLSSYTGMVADDSTIFVTDANSHIHAFDTSTGNWLWDQGHLEARGLTGPALFKNQYLVMGDNEGYVHWINKSDGSFAAQTYAGSSMSAAPVVDHNMIYIITNNGTLIAYTLR